MDNNKKLSKVDEFYAVDQQLRAMYTAMSSLNDLVNSLPKGEQRTRYKNFYLSCLSDLGDLKDRRKELNDEINKLLEQAQALTKDDK